MKDTVFLGGFLFEMPHLLPSPLSAEETTTGGAVSKVHAVSKSIRDQIRPSTITEPVGPLVAVEAKWYPRGSAKLVEIKRKDDWTRRGVVVGPGQWATRSKTKTITENHGLDSEKTGDHESQTAAYPEEHGESEEGVSEDLQSFVSDNGALILF